MAQKLITTTPEFHSKSLFNPLNDARPEPPQPPEPTHQYKALVYVNLDGGLDSFNTLVPHSNCNKGENVLLSHVLYFIFLLLLTLYHACLEMDLNRHVQRV